MINRYMVPLAVPLLLFDSDLKRVINDTGTLLAAFGVGAFATIVGTIAAFPIIPLKSLGADTGRELRVLLPHVILVVPSTLWLSPKRYKLVVPLYQQQVSRLLQTENTSRRKSFDTTHLQLYESLFSPGQMKSRR